MNKKWILISLTGLILLTLIAACAQSTTPETVAPETEVTDTRALIVERCSDCHSADRVFNANYTTEAEWSNLIDRMIDKGAVVSPEEKELMVDYLLAQD